MLSWAQLVALQFAKEECISERKSEVDAGHCQRTERQERNRTKCRREIERDREKYEGEEKV